MLIKTILNKCHKLKSFVYKSVELAIYRGAEVLDITVVPRKNGLAICSGCHKPAPGYDRLKKAGVKKAGVTKSWGHKRRKKGRKKGHPLFPEE